MLNLLRMDPYRMRKGKAAYICLGIILATIALVYFLLFLMLTPTGQAAASRLGMMDFVEMEEAKALFREINLLLVFRQSNMDGGFFALVLTIYFTIFVCADFKNGFIKNIMSVHVNRWKYIGSKILSFAILDIIYLAASYLFTFLVNLLMGGNIPVTGFSSVLFFLAQAWVLTMAMLALVLLVCMLTRSIAAGILAAVLVSSGVIVTLLNALLGLFHVNGWLKYTLYFSLQDAPEVYQSPADLAGFAVGIVFLIVYMVIAGTALSKKDI